MGRSELGKEGKTAEIPELNLYCRRNRIQNFLNFCRLWTALLRFSHFVNVLIFNEQHSKDIRAIISAVPGGTRPWMLYGVTNPVVAGLRPSVVAYLPPSTSTSKLIRGTAVGIVQSAKGKWEAVPFQGDYAQIAIPSVPFDSMRWDLIPNRPFWVDGNLADEELLELINFVHEKQESRVLSDIILGLRTGHPIRRVRRRNTDAILITFCSDDFSGMDFSFIRQGQTWNVTGPLSWVN